MSASTTTTAYRDMSRRQAIELCYILEEQRDKQIERAKVAEAKVAAGLALHAPVEIEPSSTICAGCSTLRGSGDSLRYFPAIEWPCETVTALTEVRAGAGASGHDCDGSSGCHAKVHEHGCFADSGDCDDLAGHKLADLGHVFSPVAGHPDDDECTYRADGTDATYCGESRSSHDAESTDSEGGR